MNIIQLELLAIACVAACACALPGIFLLLRGVALMSDAISHAILLGIVLMFLIVKTLYTPLLLIGAALAGLATVFATQALIQTDRIKTDAAIGLVFPLFFSLGVILISLFARNVHLDTDMVLLGEMAFAPFNRLIVGGLDRGPVALWQLLGVLGVNILFVALFYKELQLTIFDPDYAAVIGFSPVILYYSLMGITSITAVAAFDAVGAIVVVALMIVPPASAFLVARSVGEMIGVSMGYSLLSAVGGCVLATVLDVSIAGSIATMAGFFFSLTLGLTVFLRYKDGIHR